MPGSKARDADKVSLELAHQIARVMATAMPHTQQIAQVQVLIRDAIVTASSGQVTTAEGAPYDDIIRLVERARGRASAMRIAPPGGKLSSKTAADEFEGAIDALLAALAAKHDPVELTAVTPHNGWQPIETAPKDGTPFLCFHHDTEFSPPTSIDLIWYEPSIKTYTMDGDNEVPFAGITHWMPLPPPPALSRADGGIEGGK
jgi:hypothetical protein